MWIPRFVVTSTTRRAMLVMFCLALFLPPGASPGQNASPGQKPKNPAIGDPKAIAAGRALFAASCAACHGATGEGGRGPNLHNRGVWHPLDDEDLFQTIQNGIPGADMPPTKLPDAQLWQIVAFVRALTRPGHRRAATRRPVRRAKRCSGRKANAATVTASSAAEACSVPT